MRCLHVILIALLVGLTAFAASEAERPQHNFLIIVDSSVSMAPHKSSAIKWVRDMIATRFDEQIEPGDSIDIWTYDTENNLRGFPPLIWEPQNAKKISDDAAVYLEKYPFKGRSDFSQVASDLALLVPQTKALLIAVITDGEEPFSGISLDLEVNGYLGKKGKIGPAAAAKSPLLVSFAAIGGALRTWTAYFGGGPIDLATLPERTRPATVVQKTPPANPRPKQQPVARAPEPKPQHPMIPSGENKFVFDFPAGTKFNPAEPAPKATPLAVKPEIRPATNALTKVAQTNAPGKTTLTNALASAAPASQTNVPKSAAAVQTNVAASVAAAKTNVASFAGTTNKLTNAIVAAVTSGASSNLAAKQGQGGKVATIGATSPATVGSSKISTQLTIRGAMYVSALTGAACILAGGYLVFRRFRRPTQSIISRSLLQR